MINKEICKRCYKDHKRIWDKCYDELWERGDFWCMGKIVTYGMQGISQRKTTDEPPYDCHYKLEHLVLENEKS